MEAHVGKARPRIMGGGAKLAGGGSYLRKVASLSWFCVSACGFGCIQVRQMMILQWGQLDLPVDVSGKKRANEGLQRHGHQRQTVAMSVNVQCVICIWAFVGSGGVRCETWSETAAQQIM